MDMLINEDEIVVAMGGREGGGGDARVDIFWEVGDGAVRFFFGGGDRFRTGGEVCLPLVIYLLMGSLGRWRS